MNNIIKKYVDILKKEDIENYALKNNILLDKNELDLIYNVIKNRYNEIYENGINVINEYKDKLKIDTYNKIIELYKKVL